MEVDSLQIVFLELYPELIAYPCLFLLKASLMCFNNSNVFYSFRNKSCRVVLIEVNTLHKLTKVRQM